MERVCNNRGRIDSSTGGVSEEDSGRPTCACRSFMEVIGSVSWLASSPCIGPYGKLSEYYVHAHWKRVTLGLLDSS